MACAATPTGRPSPHGPGPCQHGPAVPPQRGRPVSRVTTAGRENTDFAYVTTPAPWSLIGFCGTTDPPLLESLHLCCLERRSALHGVHIPRMDRVWVAARGVPVVKGIGPSEPPPCQSRSASEPRGPLAVMHRQLAKRFGTRRGSAPRVPYGDAHTHTE